MKEKQIEEIQKEFLEILGRIKNFLVDEKYDTAKSEEYYIIKNDLFANDQTNE